MSVTSPPGFVAGAAVAGIKPGDAPDMALVATADGVSATAAAVFTQNLAVAAPVQVSREHLAATGGQAAAVVLTAGNANAATGEPGRLAAHALCAEVGAGIGCRPEEVLICQTGLIGVPFPLEVAQPAVAPLVASLGADAAAARAAATAIMTTDTVVKEATVHGDGFTVGAMAKGAAMLAPDMATMLAVLTTDAALPAPELLGALRTAVGSTFNELSVDGCTSTNDTVAVLANGRAGPVPAEQLTEALREACATLAAAMAADAEGATKVARVVVTGARSHEEAHRAARRVAGSLLVKCSLNGADPYWGRVVSELGSAGVGFDPDQVAVAYGGVTVCRSGVAAPHDEDAVAAHMAGDQILLACDLGLGDGRGEVLATDLGYGYIDENRGTS